MKHIVNDEGSGYCGAQCLAAARRITAKSESRKIVENDPEFSSVVEACVDKNALESLRRSVFPS